MSKPTVLLPAQMPALVIEQLAARYELVELATAENPDKELSDCADRVRAIATQGTAIDRAFMQALPNLQIVANFGVGYDKVDAKAAADLGIIVTNTPDVLNAEVADTTIALLLMTVRQLPQADQHVRKGLWPAQSFPLTPSSLQGRSIGIVGMGRIGEAIAHRLESFGVAISYHARNCRDHLSYPYFSDIVALASAVDTLVVIVPGGTATHHMINKEVLEALGKNGILINVARGSVVDEQALIQALENKVIYSAGLDVFENEPAVPQALIDMEHVVLLPHVGSASEPTRNAMSQLVVDNVVAWLENGTAITPVAETPLSGS
ncbi:2-hydroxyacid dehydrogenase [Granulosicoccus antarcticus]|uniref:2-ketogluconate reductase n=1 Tax=Granulosicoccus antarcticus IMCC3135 TaxID=1192854 RepID=A0A2Z2NJS5_9GAMM|nr:2-hydroxyacid dehydrogenase [Granulosicoccus antarcticus]ASJ71556.1 2-ketogluconate reductase [Granulosicoccus antarcticus IMCC3135]